MKLEDFFSHGYWRGVGGIVGIFALLFAIFTFFDDDNKEIPIKQSFENTGIVQQTFGSNSNIINK